MAFYAIHLGIFKAGVFGDSRGQVGFREIGSKKETALRLASLKMQPTRDAKLMLAFLHFAL